MKKLVKVLRDLVEELGNIHGILNDIRISVSSMAEDIQEMKNSTNAMVDVYLKENL